MVGLAQQLITNQAGYDEDFLDDAQGMFPDEAGWAPTTGSCGKYLYSANNWQPVLADHTTFYAPDADQELMQLALNEIADYLPVGTPYIDFGAGGIASFKRYALPAIQKIGSKKYTGVDFCEAILSDIMTLSGELSSDVSINTALLDLFLPTTRNLSPDQPALGVMNGLTIGNMRNVRSVDAIRNHLTSTLQYLSRLAGNGWLLVSMDSNQDKKYVEQAYNIPPVAGLIRNMMWRIAKELPCEGFDPSAFSYAPHYDATLNRLEHLLVSEKEQEFILGDRIVNLKSGQEIHLVSSYKYSEHFFEQCCASARLSVTRRWHHQSGVLLYLLTDSKLASRQELQVAV